jgi:hypothetical protein
MAFEYSTLKTDELRLLRPVPGVDDQDIRFEISDFPRHDTPPYTAVSYTWGEGELTETVQLNERLFSVCPNLWSCLYFLRFRTGRGGRWNESIEKENLPCWQYIWVDAICIDQTNDSERSAQARLMDRTYRNAATVSIWLGLARAPADMGSHPDAKDMKMFDDQGRDWCECSITDLANRSYWSRVWII